MNPGSGRLTIDDVRAGAMSGDIDWVLLAFVDMQGRLQGKRCSVAYFLDHVLADGSAACDYLLTVDVEMTPRAGYDLAGWDAGYGDLQLVPDLSTLRRVAWQPGTAICISDAYHPSGAAVEVSPRAILRRQLDRLAERGWSAHAATELEFIVHRESYAEAWSRDYRGLTPVNRYNVDYSLFGSSEADPLLSELATALGDSGFRVETIKGEANPGQHEINLEYEAALAAADSHVLFKHAVKEVARRHERSATFMAKWDEREGNSCHVHFSLVDADGAAVFAEHPEVLERFVAGQLAAQRELVLAFAPNVNSYKRYAASSFAPTAVAWGEDNRSCALRLVGTGSGRRFENRVAGADANPYLVIAAIIAAGLHGVDAELALPAPETGNAYAGAHPRLPASLDEAIELWDASAIAAEAFGPRVVRHYAHAARIERDEHRAAVTDWERRRGYERL